VNPVPVRVIEQESADFAPPIATAEAATDPDPMSA
jgi:hypothetical protein